MHTVSPYITVLFLILIAGVCGEGYVRKIVEVREARRELRSGSISHHDMRRGRWWILLWVFTLMIIGTIIGDWATSESLTGALGRFFYRIWQIIVVIFEPR